MQPAAATPDYANMSPEEAAAAATAAAAMPKRRASVSMTGMVGGLVPTGGPSEKFVPSKEAMANALAKAEQSRFENDLAAMDKTPPKKVKEDKKGKGEIKIRAMGQKWKKRFVLIVSPPFQDIKTSSHLRNVLPMYVIAWLCCRRTGLCLLAQVHRGSGSRNSWT